MLEASPKKLRSGEWGALVRSEAVAKGDAVKVTTRSGKSWVATVAKVVWKGEGVAICATAASGGGRSRARGECRRCGCTDPTCGGSGGGICRGPSFDPCHDCI